MDSLITKGIQDVMISKMDVDILNAVLDILLEDNKISKSDIGRICEKYNKYDVPENGCTRIELILIGYQLIKEDASSNYPGSYISTDKSKIFRDQNYFKEINERQISENLPQQQLLEIRRNRIKSNIAIIISLATLLISILSIILSIANI